MAGRPRKAAEPKAPFAKRLQQLVGTEKYRDFEAKCNLKVSTISRLLLRGSVPGSEIVEKIVTGTGCNPQWLISGDGEPFGESDAALPAKTAALAEEYAKTMAGLSAQYNRALSNPADCDAFQKLLQAITLISDNSGAGFNKEQASAISAVRELIADALAMARTFAADPEAAAQYNADVCAGVAQMHAHRQYATQPDHPAHHETQAGSAEPVEAPDEKQPI